MRSYIRLDLSVAHSAHVTVVTVVPYSQRLGVGPLPANHAVANSVPDTQPHKFTSYTCINWLRALPYVRAWAARYKEQGLVVIGMHKPECTFEEDVDNVQRAAKDMPNRSAMF